MAEVDLIEAQKVALKVLQVLAQEPSPENSFEGLCQVFGDVCHQLKINSKNIRILATRALKAAVAKEKAAADRAAKAAADYTLLLDAQGGCLQGR